MMYHAEIKPTIQFQLDWSHESLILTEEVVKKNLLNSQLLIGHSLRKMKNT